jgi:hypothetical protein
MDLVPERFYLVDNRAGAPYDFRKRNPMPEIAGCYSRICIPTTR